MLKTLMDINLRFVEALKNKRISYIYGMKSPYSAILFF